MQVLNPSLLETLTHELINTVGLVAMNFELLTEAAEGEATRTREIGAFAAPIHLSDEFSRVEISIKDAVDVLQLLNACAVTLRREDMESEARQELLVPILKWHVKRFGLPQTRSTFTWSVDRKGTRFLSFETDEHGIFERGDGGLPMCILGIISLKDKMELSADRSTARFIFAGADSRSGISADGMS